MTFNDIAVARAEAVARREAGTPMVCDDYRPSTVRYITRGHRMSGYLCRECAYPRTAHPSKHVPVPPSTRIKTKSMLHIDTERHLARLEYLRENLQRLARECEQKNDFRSHVREVINIERVLTLRGVEFVFMTDGRHLDQVDVNAVPIVRPPKEREKEAA